MNYRLLPPDEWDRLKDIIDERYLPRPEAATAAIAEDENGQILGVLFLQLQLHMEPLVISSPKVNFKRLHAVLHSAVEEQHGLRYFAFVDTPEVARMAELVGMEPIVDKQVWSKEVS